MVAWSIFLAIRPWLVAFIGTVAILIAVDVGCGTKPARSTAVPKPAPVAVEPAVDPGDVTAITLNYRDGPGAKVPGSVILIRTDKNAHYFHRLAKAMIDNGFFKLERVYFGGFDGPGIEISVKCGNRERVVVNSDYRTLTDPTYLFEMLIVGADADIRARLGPERD